MPVGWCIGPMRRRPNRTRIDAITGQPLLTATRYCALDDYSALVLADGGWWAFSEVAGQRFIGKVRASAATLQTIQADPDIAGISHNQLSEPLADLTAAQKAVVQTQLLLIGFTQQEIDAASGGDWGTRTLGQLMRFCASKLAARDRFDPVADVVVCDGPTYLPTQPELVAAQV